MYNHRSKLYNLETQINQRMPNPNIISVPYGYEVEVFIEGLDAPSGMVFDDNGDLLIADSGISTDEPKVLRVSGENIEIVADNFNTPLSGINQLNGNIYVSHKGSISIIRPDGSRNDIINGLPSNGDYTNNRVEFSNDNRIYFGQGTATNSGVVGLDNEWIFEQPFFHDIVGTPVILRQVNYATENILVPADHSVLTGAFTHFSSERIQTYEMIIGDFLASGSILSANLDGSDLSLAAWGFRNPFQVKFNMNNELIISSQGMDIRGSRPIANAPDTLERLIPGAWYGWPDYAAGELVASPQFTPPNGVQPESLLETIPSIPPRPIARLTPDSNILGFDFNYNPEFGPIGDIYIAAFGRTFHQNNVDYIRSGVGHRINRINLQTGEVTTFAINRSGFPEPGGFGRPTDVIFGHDGAMYISDAGYDTFDQPNVYPPGSGMIWRIRRL